MEGKLRDAVEILERGGVWGENQNVKAFDLLLTLARQYLAVIEKGEMPSREYFLHNPSCKGDSVRNCSCGAANQNEIWEECHDAFMPLLVAKEREIEELKDKLYPVIKFPIHSCTAKNSLQEYEAERTRLDRLERLPDGWFKDKFLTKLKGRDYFWSPDSIEKHIHTNEADGYAAQYGQQPEIDELESLVDRKKSNPAIIEAAKVLNLKTDGWYLSKTPVAGNSSNVWCVGFGYGFVNYYYKGTKFYVRPVRSL